MIHKGYIKTFRKLMDWEWYQEANTMRLFIHCLLMANYEEKQWKGITIPIGSFITSSSNLAHDLKLTRAEIRHAIYNLQTTSEIAIKTTNKYTIIAVRNWALYQGLNEDETTNKETIEQLDLQPSNNHNIRNKEERKKKDKEIKADTTASASDASSEKKVKHRFGSFKNVLLTDDENERLHKDYTNADELIEYLSYHIEMKGYKANNHNLAIRKWVPNAVKEDAIRKAKLANGGSAYGKPTPPDVRIEWLAQYWDETKGEKAPTPKTESEIKEIEEYLATLQPESKQYVRIKNHLDNLRREANQA